MIKIGIIGAGRIGRVHGEGVTYGVKDAQVKAIADPFMNEEIKQWANGLGIASCYTDYHQILEDPEIDAVMICSSTDTHADISIEAIKAGKHVFCEKPISQDLAKIKEVMEALKETKLKFQVGFNRRFDHNFKAVRNAVEAGQVGDVHLIRVTARDPQAPPIEYVRVSGGMFLDMTIHDFDMVCFLSGCKVKEVYAAGAALVNPDIAKEGDIDTAVITMKMENGAIAVIDNSRQAVYGYDQRAEVFGSKGQVAVANDTGSSAVLSTQDGVIGEKPLYFFLERYMDSFKREVSEFVQAIVDDTEVPVDIEAGLQPILIAIAAKKSLDENRPIQLTEVQF
ncbi:myo-inositol 2-dehydrogenase [Lachnotalea glycerini]|uniref:Inositol 2-dehydrogenase n=1 Tax=Lachnotalea glycerini TaxID=1763509 RepID=A0A255IT08_9FIRM|nr:inositol 2-dehydrogenase [Lachnotalea glycerini]PXV93444.1 myo-inositol 2-dehydrogenase [Lachnotalea glycerini]RDY31827.1 inositol 2-dehydrogenase [Lachnotalea glycerini]